MAILHSKNLYHSTVKHASGCSGESISNSRLPKAHASAQNLRHDRHPGCKKTFPHFWSAPTVLMYAFTSLPVCIFTHHADCCEVSWV